MDTKRDQAQDQEGRHSDVMALFWFAECRGEPGCVLKESSEKERAKPEAEADGDGA